MGYQGYGGYCGCGGATCDICATVDAPEPYVTTLGSNAYAPTWDLTQYHNATQDIYGNEITLPRCGQWRVSAPYNCNSEIESGLKPYLKTGSFDTEGNFLGLPDAIETDKVLYLDIRQPRCEAPSSRYPDGRWMYDNSFPGHPAISQVLAENLESMDEYIGEGVVSPDSRWAASAWGLADCNCNGAAVGCQTSEGYVSNMGELVGLPNYRALNEGGKIIKGGFDVNNATYCWGPYIECISGVVIGDKQVVELLRFIVNGDNEVTIDASSLVGPGVGRPRNGWCIWAIGGGGYTGNNYPKPGCLGEENDWSGFGLSYLRKLNGEDALQSGLIDDDGFLVGLEPTMIAAPKFPYSGARVKVYITYRV